MIPCNFEFRAYAYADPSDECVSTKLRVTGNHVFHFSHFELYFALHSCVLSTFQQHLLQFPTVLYIYIYIYCKLVVMLVSFILQSVFLILQKFLTLKL